MPIISLFEIENETVIDLLASEDDFESHISQPKYKNVRLSSRRDVRAIFKLSRLLSQNFDESKAVDCQSSSFCRLLQIEEQQCKTLNIVGNVHFDELLRQNGSLFSFVQPMMKTSQNVIIYTDSSKIQLLQLKSRPISLQITLSELILTQIDVVLKDYEDDVFSSADNDSQTNIVSQAGILDKSALQQQQQNVSTDDTAIFNANSISVEKAADQVISTIADHTSCQTLKEVDFQKPISELQQFSDDADQQLKENAKQDELTISGMDAKASVPEDQYQQALKALKQAERVRIDLEAKLRLTEATASEYLLKQDIQKINTEMHQNALENCANADEFLKNEESGLEKMQMEYIQQLENEFQQLKEQIENSGKQNSIAVPQQQQLIQKCKNALNQRISKENQLFQQMKNERLLKVQQFRLQQMKNDINSEQKKFDDSEKQKQSLQQQLQQLQDIKKAIDFQIQQKQRDNEGKKQKLQQIQQYMLQMQQLKQLLGRAEGTKDQEYTERCQNLYEKIENEAKYRLLTPDEARLREELKGVVFYGGAKEEITECQQYFQQEQFTDLEGQIMQKLQKLLAQK